MEMSPVESSKIEVLWNNPTGSESSSDILVEWVDGLGRRKRDKGLHSSGSWKTCRSVIVCSPICRSPGGKLSQTLSFSGSP